MSDPAGDGGRSRRARLVVLDPSERAARAFARIASECQDHWRSNVDGLLADRDVEDLHQTRVGIRRLRSAYSLFRRALRREPEFLATAAELRLRALPLGPARDLDVILGSPLVAGLDASGLARLRGLREAAYDAVEATLTSPEWLSLADRVDALVAAPPRAPSDDPALPVLAREALDLRWGRVARRGRRLADLPPAARHGVRIEAKKLRYGAQFFFSLYPGGNRPDPLTFAETVAALQDALGALNDVEAARRVLTEVGATVPATVEGGELLAQAVRAGTRVAALAPFWR